MTTLRWLTLPFVLLAIAGCGDDAVSFSQPVGLNIKVKAADTINAAVDGEKAVTTESGNPYGAFVNDAQTKLGRDPRRITLEFLQLDLGASSTGVTSLDEVFASDIQVLFQMNDTNNTYPAGSFAAPGAGATSLDGDATFDSDAVGAEDYAKLLSGSFKVAIRGDAATPFQVAGPEADLQVTCGFVAYQ